MNHRNHQTGPSADTGAQQGFDEREWQAQERAMRDGRDTAADDGDALTARYRMIDQALRDPPLTPLPLDFAASVARQARNAHKAGEERFERILSHVLIAALGVSAVVICVIHGAQWWPAIAASVPSGSGSWLPLIALCIGTHWMLERWRERRTSR